MEQRLLIVGASGYVGRNLVLKLGQARVIATYNRNPFAGGVRFDSLSMRVNDIIRDPGIISSAIIMLGDTRHDSCALNKSASNALNVDSVISVIRNLRDLGIHIIFTSTDNVFDGRRGNYAEEDDPNPIVTYGRQKVEVERFLAAEVPNHSIVRLSKVYGCVAKDGTLFTDWLEAIRAGKVIRVAVDQIFSAVFIEDVVDNLIALTTKRLGGIYHLGGPRGASRAELLDILLKELPHELASGARVERCSINDFGLAEPRPLNCSMISSKIAAATGVAMTPPESVARMVSNLA